MPFDRGYFTRQYRARAWRSAGAKPVLDRTRVRWLRRYANGGRLLEIGCGLGHFANMASRHFDVVVVDLEPEIVHRASAHAAIRGTAASAYQLPFADGSLGAVCCFDVLEHLTRPEACLAEAFRTLKPGGVFFMSVPNPESWGARRKGQGSFIYRDPTHCSIRTAGEWQTALTGAGFRQAWAGTDGLWDPPYFRHLPNAIQWPLFVGASQIAWLLAPGFPWSQGENFTWLGRRP